MGRNPLASEQEAAIMVGLFAMAMVVAWARQGFHTVA
jgi:hypothetical protein